MNLPVDIEERLHGMFIKTQRSFDKNKSSQTDSFMSYNYCLHKMFQLMKEDEYLKFFPLFKSHEKLLMHDYMWKKICSDLNWEFIPSV